MNDESLIRASLTEWQQAFCRKDVDALMALYAPGAVLYAAGQRAQGKPMLSRREWPMALAVLAAAAVAGWGLKAGWLSL